MIKIKQKPPAFALKDQENSNRSLDEFIGKWLVIYFYPKDDTPGCTIEACAFRDNFNHFKEKGITVLGISKDSIESHHKFAGKHKLPFILLSDKEGNVIKKYGAWGKKKFMGREYEGIKRMTFLVNPKGHIAKIYEKVNPAGHAKQILDDIEILNSA